MLPVIAFASAKLNRLLVLFAMMREYRNPEVLRGKQSQTVNHRIVASIVRDQRDLIVKSARRNPRIGRLNRMPFSPGCV